MPHPGDPRLGIQPERVASATGVLPLRRRRVGTTTFSRSTQAAFVSNSLHGPRITRLSPPHHLFLSWTGRSQPTPRLSVQISPSSICFDILQSLSTLVRLVGLVISLTLDSAACMHCFLVLDGVVVSDRRAVGGDCCRVGGGWAGAVRFRVLVLWNF